MTINDNKSWLALLINLQFMIIDKRNGINCEFSQIWGIKREFCVLRKVKLSDEIKVIWQIYVIHWSNAAAIPDYALILKDI